MGLIDRAILQDEIGQALNALFRNGQVPRIERTIEVIGSKTAAAYAESINISMTTDVTEGKLYRVTVNGIKEEIVAKKGEINSASVAYIGNLALKNSNYEDTGEHFLIYTTSTRKHTCYATDPTTNDISVDRNITVELITETIVPIDLKFIPVELLPVSIDLSVTLPDYTGDIVDVPKEEGDRIMEAFQNGISNIWITAKSKAGREYLCRLSSLCGSESGIEFVFDAGQFKYSIAYVGGGWKMALGATNP